MWINEIVTAAWQLDVRIEPQGDQLVVAEVRIRPTADVPPGGLTRRMLRNVTAQPALDRANALRLADTYKDLVGVEASYRDVARVNATYAELSEATLAAPRRPGSRGRPDLFYAELAAVYVDAVASGNRAPVQHVRAELARGGEHYAAGTVTGMIQDARRRRMLTKPPRGQAGGALTDRARRLLNLPK